MLAKLKGEMSCLASDNKKWKIIRRKCVDCPSCPLGKARNFSEHYDGPSVPEGDTLCLPCRECPEEYFAGENECQPCNIFCDTDFKREFDEICKTSHDAECGSCLFGYEDIYRNTKMPCSFKQEHPIVHAPIRNNQEQSDWNENEIENNNIGQTVNSSSEYSADVDLNVQSSNEVNSDGTNFPVFRTSVIIIVCIILVISITLVWLVWFRRKRRHQRTENIEASKDDNDIQTDGGDSQYSSQTEVGGELRLGGTVPLLHSKLSYPSNHVGTHPLGICINGSILYVLPTEHTSLSCGCQDDPHCQCYISDLPETEIQKNDKYILTVSTSICHSPDNLFNALSLDYTVIYPIQNDRELDPIGTTFQDKNLRVLNRWVEIQSTPLTLHTLMKALCESGFHKINQKLKEKYSINRPLLETDSGESR